MEEIFGKGGGNILSFHIRVLIVYICVEHKYVYVNE